MSNQIKAAALPNVTDTLQDLKNTVVDLEILKGHIEFTTQQLAGISTAVGWLNKILDENEVPRSVRG